MRKEEFEAILSGGEGGVDVGPIEDQLFLLATERRLPDLAVAQCAVMIEESAPALLDVLERAARAAPLTKEDEILLFRGLYILGGGQQTQAFQPLLRLLRLPTREIDRLLGDLVTQDLSRIAAGTFDGDADALFGVIADASVDQYVRDALLGAATFLTWNGQIKREQTKDWLVRFFNDRLAEPDDEAWRGWLQSIALLGLRELEPLADDAFKAGLAPDFSYDREDFDQDLREAEQRPDDIERFRERRLGLIEDSLEALQWTDYVGDELQDEEDPFTGEPLDLLDWMPLEPVRNPMRNVGRNDPCPCGSGKKAKKCCLARKD
ncbi:DUF1186 domain-containing protein [Bradyrhizobium sp. BRP22]|nr:DUF1186 domain-containing protein [Bradyrhizobium sp. BRP22]MCA1453445.1 DUF1186 domain-containing protein [Bradyrhizobium sp. BRP22]